MCALHSNFLYGKNASNFCMVIFVCVYYITFFVWEKCMVILYGKNTSIFCMAIFCVRVLHNIFVWEKMYGNFCMGALHSNFCMGKMLVIFCMAIFVCV